MSKCVILGWIGFLLVIGAILLLAKYELGITITIGAIIFALFSLVNPIFPIIEVLSDPSVLFLAIAVALIPILGGIMDESGLMLELIQNMNVSKRVSIIVSPALFGVFPVPGGALMSAPMVDQIDKSIDDGRKVAINVWYRHVVILLNPLSQSLIVPALIAGLDRYYIVLLMIFPFVLLIVIGYIFLVKSIKKSPKDNERNLTIVLYNLIPIITAPVIDILGRFFFPFIVPELFLVIGLVLSIGISLKMGNLKLIRIKSISKKMRIWRFPLLIFGMFLFLEVFLSSGLPIDISNLNLPFILFIFIAFFLGFATGRIQLPMSILIPIYLVQNLISMMPLLNFIILYLSVFLGYLITPIHPCVSYSMNYYETSYSNVIKKLLIPTFVSFTVFFGIYLIWSLF
ncbi:MAG: DUF401 family protein [Candidatus Lokiarchaeota archaeon]|nr:DUF401 family protein [Candidatus Lokiarchaeota archaeon]MBD3201053.1 DUF401 family protein [Candidatus Lokiarchaeota archaeon]